MTKTANRMRTRRRAALGAITAFGALATVGTSMPAGAEVTTNPDTPKVPDIPDNVRLPWVGDDGFIHYPLADSQRAVKTVRHPGKPTADGGCTIGGTTVGDEDAHTYVEIETALDPKTCDYDITYVEEPQTDKGARAFSTYSVVGSKGSWVDPIDITINSMAANLEGYWDYNSKNATYSWGAYQGENHGYEYHGLHEQWTTTGDNPPWYVWGDSFTLHEDGSEHFQDTDFEDHILFDTIGPVATLAACGFNTNAAVFDIYQEAIGYANGGADQAWNDSASGGCVNLVHHREDTPAARYVKY